MGKAPASRVALQGQKNKQEWNSLKVRLRGLGNQHLLVKP